MSSWPGLPALIGNWLVGFEKPTSRESGIMTGSRLDKVKAWIKQDMGTAFDPVYGQAIDCLERVTVRASMVHGDSVLVSAQYL